MAAVVEVEASVAPPVRARSKEHWIVLIGAFVALALFVALGFLVHPDERGFGTHEQLGLPSCKLMDWTGVPCPGCGVTTSVAFASRGHVLDALRTQPFGLVVALTIVALPVWALALHLSGQDLYRALQSRRAVKVGLALAVLLAIGWIYKLIVVLAPHWLR
jgi:hypothetical protein